LVKEEIAAMSKKRYIFASLVLLLLLISTITFVFQNKFNPNNIKTDMDSNKKLSLSKCLL